MAGQFANKRGSVLALVLVVSVVLSGLVVAMAWTAGEASQRTGALLKQDQAFFAAEAGAARLQWYCRHGQTGSVSTPLTGSANGFNYSVTWSTGATSVAVTSVGSYGNISYTLSESVLSGTPPTLAAGGNFDSKNIDVTGNVLVAGNYSDSGSGSLTGNLTYYGTATDLNTVTGTATQATGSFTPLDFSSLGTSLMAAAGASYSGAQSGVNFNFSALPGTDKVIYVNGNVSNPTFTGGGTLYVNGTVSVGGFGSAANPVNIVATGDVTTSNNVTIYGSIYTLGEWYRGKFHLTGMVYIGTTVQTGNFGQSSLTQGTAPWFDPRIPGGAASSAEVSNFAGPMP